MKNDRYESRVNKQIIELGKVIEIMKLKLQMYVCMYVFAL